eukprot:16434892-Heterocapsa_arctica.AAC.1
MLNRCRPCRHSTVGMTRLSFGCKSWSLLCLCLRQAQSLGASLSPAAQQHTLLSSLYAGALRSYLPKWFLMLTTVVFQPDRDDRTTSCVSQPQTSFRRGLSQKRWKGALWDSWTHQGPRSREASASSSRRQHAPQRSLERRAASRRELLQVPTCSTSHTSRSTYRRHACSTHA